MSARSHARLLLLASVTLVAASFAACGDDDTADTTPDTGGGTDTESPDEDTSPDTSEPPPPIEIEVTMELINANPGALSRWVEVRNAAGQPGWWNINEDTIALQELRAHQNCGFPVCGQPAGELCGAQEPEIRELAPSESITGTWNLTLYDLETATGGVCQRPFAADAASYRVQFCWSPNPPVEGRLDPNTLSCTRLPFALGGDATVSYAIEGLATCGNGTCDPGETSLTCAQDCTSITPTDAVIACARSCTRGSQCSPDVQRDVCELQVCSALDETLDGASDVCIEAVRDLFACAAALDCDGWLAWNGGEPDNDCALEAADQAAACGSE